MNVRMPRGFWATQSSTSAISHFKIHSGRGTLSWELIPPSLVSATQQSGHQVIAYVSKTFPRGQRNCSATQRELWLWRFPLLIPTNTIQVSFFAILPFIGRSSGCTFSIPWWLACALVGEKESVWLENCPLSRKITHPCWCIVSRPFILRRSFKRAAPLPPQNTSGWHSRYWLWYLSACLAIGSPGRPSNCAWTFQRTPWLFDLMNPVLLADNSGYYTALTTCPQKQ